jgi:hypothetical protein
MTAPAARPSLVQPPSAHTRCDSGRAVLSLLSTCRAVQRSGLRLSPCGATRPFRTWLLDIALLWSALWLQLAIVQGTLGEVVAISLFAIACALTVLYGMRSYTERSGLPMSSLTRVTGSRDTEVTLRGRQSRSRRASCPKAPAGIVRSSAAGVGLLGLISWIPLTPLLGLLVIGAFLGSPIALLLAASITGVIAAGGFLLLVLLIGLGRLLALWIGREH